MQVGLILDGGNLIKGKDWIILTDKVFVENPSRDRKTIINELENLFQAKPIIVPREPNDFTGHADGQVRYYGDDTVLINRYRTNDKPAFQERFKAALRREGLNLIEVPYNPYRNADYDSAVGIYINYLQVKDLVVVPTLACSKTSQPCGNSRICFRSAMWLGLNPARLPFRAVCLTVLPGISINQ